MDFVSVMIGIAFANPFLAFVVLVIILAIIRGYILFAIDNYKARDDAGKEQFKKAFVVPIVFICIVAFSMLNK